MLPPSQPGVQDHPQILDQLGTVQSNSKEKRFKETRKFPFSCKYDRVSLVRVN
jgi:hypothetical protein